MSIRDLIGKVARSHGKVALGSADPPGWIHTGCWALNYRLSGDFHRGIPMGHVTMFAGESGAGKSLVVSGYIVRRALEDGVDVVLIDTENAILSDWLRRLDIDPDHPRLVRVMTNEFETLLGLLGEFFENLRKENEDRESSERRRVLVAIDSLGMLMTTSEIEALAKGGTSEDRGRRAKMVGALMRLCVSGCAATGAAVVATNHVYRSQDIFAAGPNVAGGMGARYGPAIRVLVSRAKLRASDVGEEASASGSTIAGVRILCTVDKTRFFREGEKLTIRVPWKGGLDPWSDIVPALVDAGILQREGRKWAWTSPNGETVRLWEKEWEGNHEGWTEKIMASLAASRET